MTRIDLPYVHRFRDRHGKVRHYFRRPGFKQTALPGIVGSDEFMAAYQAAMAGQEPSPAVGSSRTKPGTISAALVGYLSSVSYLQLSATAKAQYRNVLERFRAQHGEKRVAMLERRHINRFLAEKVETPEAANMLLRLLRILMRWCVTEGMVKDDPTTGLKAIRTRTDGFNVWPENYIAQYRAHHALGTRARLAFELLLCTGQRRGDVVRMGRQHVREGTLSLKQSKTGAFVQIPVLPELVAAIDAMPASSNMTFLVTEYGKPFTPAGFGQWFRARCDEAGIPAGYAAHGLRKAAATEYANQTASAHELMAWFGWTTLKEAERYTRGADRKRLAAGMVRKLQGTASGKP